MRAFKLQIGGENEIIAADTAIQALKYYCKNTGLSLTDDKDFDDYDDIEEIPKEKWNDTVITNVDYDSSDPEDKKTNTLTELMDGVVSPEMISTTCY